MINLRSSPLKIHALCSTLDPIISSAALFLIQGAVLLTSNKLDFALFSVSYSYIVMGQAVMSALFGPPMITLLGHYDSKAQNQVGQAVLRYQLLIAIGLALFGVAVATAIGITGTLSLLAALGLLGLSYRDALRSVLAAQSKFGEILLLTASFAVVTVVMLMVIYLVAGKVTSTAALLALAVATTSILVPHLVQCLTSAAQLSREALVRVAKMATWSLPGVIVIWLQNNFYLTIVAVHLSMDAVAEVSAARMVVMPAMVASTGISRFFQVHASERLNRLGLAAVLADARTAALGVFAVGAVLVAIVEGLGQTRLSLLLPKHYPDLIALVVSWIFFATCVIARGFFSSVFQAMGRYKEIFLCNVAILPLVLAGAYFAPLALGVSGVVYSLTAGEFLLLAALMLRARFGVSKSLNTELAREAGGRTGASRG